MQYICQWENNQLPRSVASDHFRQVDSVSTAEGAWNFKSMISLSYHQFSRSEHISDKESIRKSLVTRGLTTSAEICYRCSESSQLPIPVLGKTGEIRPVIDLFFPNRQPIVPHVQSNRNSILT